jgi:hypothetical protein
MHAEVRTTPSTPGPEKRTIHSLSQLIDLPPSELERLYKEARVPALDAIHGDLRGRMLAWAQLPERANRILARLARSDRFPWRGKSFSFIGSGRGEGMNRVLRDRWKLFRFETSIGPSRAGSFDAVQLNYDVSKNPAVIRAIKDEIRELQPGLYLGQAYLMWRGQPKLVLYFGLEA